MMIARAKNTGRITSVTASRIRWRGVFCVSVRPKCRTMFSMMTTDPSTTIPDHNGRPMYLLDDRVPITALL